MTQSNSKSSKSKVLRRYLADRMGPAERIALVLSLGWLALTGIVFAVLPGGATGGGAATGLMTFLAIFLPVALFWIGAAAAGNAQRLRFEGRQLEARVEAALQDRSGDLPEGGADQHVALEQKLDEIARVQKKTEAAVAHLTALSSRLSAASRSAEGPGAASQPPRASVDLEQPTLALVPLDSTPDAQVSVEDFISALNFPTDPSDKAGFRALARALRDPQAKGLVRSSEDVLTLLAEDGLYVDDLTPDRAHPSVWRRFAQGQRGHGIAELGGIRDRETLARVAGRLRQDPVFRDCAHHFLRRFDTMLAGFEPGASDTEIAALTETRTARAFMLIGRVSGTFD